jgi:hypothetical protein
MSTERLDMGQWGQKEGTKKETSRRQCHTTSETCACPTKCFSLLSGWGQDLGSPSMCQISNFMPYISDV